MNPLRGDPNTVFVRLAVNYVRARGGDPLRVLEGVGIPPDLSGLKLEHLHEAWEALSEAVGDPNLGISVSASLPKGTFGIYEYLCRTSPTLGEAWHQLIRFNRLLNRRALMTFHQEGRRAIFDLHIPGEPLALGRHVNELILFWVLRVCRELTLQQVPAEEVWLAHAAPDDTRGGAAAFGVRPQFGLGTNRLIFDASVVKLPVVSSDPALNQLLVALVDAIVPNTSSSVNLIAKVRSVIEDTLPERAATTERVALRLRMSGRTLRRKLGEGRVTFGELVGEVRREQALDLIRNEDVTLQEISSRLGYSDVTAFIRAFRCWMGVTPADYRRRSAGAST